MRAAGLETGGHSDRGGTFASARLRRRWEFCRPAGNYCSMGSFLREGFFPVEGSQTRGFFEGGEGGGGER
jgi:hypothetical protein